MKNKNNLFAAVTLTLIVMTPSASAQSAGSATPCPYGMTLTRSAVTGISKCIGKHINTYSDYRAWMTNPNKSPTDNWLIGSAQPMSESEWNDQRARAAADLARGITFGGGGSGSSQLQSNTASQDYTGEIPAATENQQGYHYVAPRELNTRTYAGYNAWMTNPNRSLIDNWLIGGAKPMSEAQWNAQNGRAAADAARGITFGGGEAQAPTSAQINAEINSLPKSQSALDNWFRTNAYTPEQMAAATGYSVADVLNASNLAFSRLAPDQPVVATELKPAPVATPTNVPGVPVGSFCAPWGNTVTWDYTGAHTDTGAPCQ